MLGFTNVNEHLQHTHSVQIKMQKHSKLSGGLVFTKGPEQSKGHMSFLASQVLSFN